MSGGLFVVEVRGLTFLLYVVVRRGLSGVEVRSFALGRKGMRSRRFGWREYNFWILDKISFG